LLPSSVSTIQNRFRKVPGYPTLNSWCLNRSILFLTVDANCYEFELKTTPIILSVWGKQIKQTTNNNEICNNNTMECVIITNCLSNSVKTNLLWGRESYSFHYQWEILAYTRDLYKELQELEFS
jgi:hypothetical protein